MDLHLLNRFSFGPSYGQPEWDDDWSRRVYAYKGATLFLDRRYASRYYEAFAVYPYPSLVWFVGEFHSYDFEEAEQTLQGLMDQHPERN